MKTENKEEENHLENILSSYDEENSRKENAASREDGESCFAKRDTDIHKKTPNSSRYHCPIDNDAQCSTVQHGF